MVKDRNSLRGRRSGGSVRQRLLGALAMSLGVVTVSVHFWQQQDSPTDEPSTPDARLIAATVARISTESEGETLPYVAQAPPQIRYDSDRDGRDLRHDLPSGYTVVKSNGSMRKLSMRTNERKEYLDLTSQFTWLNSSRGVNALAAQAKENGREQVFGWLRLEPGKREDELTRSLNNAGAEIVGASGRLLRVLFPAEKARIEAIAQLPGVNGIGALPIAEKLRAFGGNPDIELDHDPMPMFITLMADDFDGQWRRELSTLGVEVGRYDAQIRVYTGNVPSGALETVASADFVQAIEPIGIVKTMHDTSVAAMGVDAVRTWTGPGVFAGIGGASVPIGVMDTGLNIRHVDISTNRLSICGINVVDDNPTEQDQDLWLDGFGHGTHVTGTIIGNGMDSAAFAGMAPSVGHVRFAKVLNFEGIHTTDQVLRAMDWLATASKCEDSEAVTPALVNVSLGNSGSWFEGRDTRARKLDATVWQRRQLYVVAQANSAARAFSNFAAAKNSLAVGATYDSGDHAPFSSHGPSADGRLAPHVVALGVNVISVRGNGAKAGYVSLVGTSMSSPTVAGVSALLMDAAPEHVRQPALVRARLMASAIRPDAWQKDAEVFATDNNKGPTGRQMRYGLGKVSARVAVLNQDQPRGWTGGGSTAEIVDDATYAYEDIDVPANTSRLDVVLTWDEPPVDGITGPVLNDLDLWLDAGADCGDGDCGERSSTSRIDNVEWVIIKNPTPGVWRLKIVGQRIHTESRAAIAWTVIRGDSTPQLSVIAENRSDDVTSDLRQVNVDLAMTVDEYVAAGTSLHFECRGDTADCEDLRIEASGLVREDGTVVEAGAPLSPARNSVIELGRSIQLGELANDETQRIELKLSHAGAKPIRFYYTANSWNAGGTSGSLLIQPATATGDTAPPAMESSNDAFHSAASLTGSEGSTQVDLAAATTQPGEPPASAIATDHSRISVWHQRPLGSLWYRFTAPSNQLTTLWLLNRSGSESVTLDVYTGKAPANLRRVASNQRRTVETMLDRFREVIIGETIVLSQSVVFFPEENQTYFIRVANSERTDSPMVLRWFQGEGPAHDDFVAALELSGPEGEIDSHNAGATLEAGESFGELAATTWHQWRAPRDGAFEFSVNSRDLRVVVFSGDDVGELRLLSGYPATDASIYARSGQIYRIAVATRDAFITGGPYSLSWISTAWEPTANDDFADRAALAGESGNKNWRIDDSATVEPDEPFASGVRTRWWSWTAPETGRYTWRLNETDNTELTLAAYVGTSILDLQFLSSVVQPVTRRELTFQAERNETYALSIGWPQGDFGGYYTDTARGSIDWGRTPENDERVAAIALSSVQSGSTDADDFYASTGLGEHNEHLGHSSLWWTWEAPANGWFTFAAEDRNLAIYTDAYATPIARRWLVRGEVTFRAREGATYTIRVSVPAASRSGGTYQLTWQRVVAPVWLKYVDATTESKASTGGPTPLSRPAALAVNDDGETLFTVSTDGLEVFTRNARDGTLMPTQSIDSDVSGSILAWDSAHHRLLANRCGDWFTFEPDGTTFADVSIDVDNDRGNCNKKILTTIDGNSVYTVDKNNAALHRYDIGDTGQLQYVDSYSDTKVIDAIVTADGRRLFITNGKSLYEFQRDTETGSIEEIASVISSGDRLGIDFDNSWLFTVDQSVGNVTAHELSPSLQPGTTINSENRVFVSRYYEPYQFVVGRQTGAVDVFGRGVAMTFDGVTSRIIDALRQGEDRFGNFIPSFNLLNDLVSSPDGRFVYASTSTKGILIFERVGAGVSSLDQ